MPDIFISYSRDDQATARQFAEALEREGFDVWWDQTLNPGDAYDHVTEKALKEAKAVAVLWSKKSVDSRWVRAEATLANRNHTLVPVMIEACERPIMFELTHTVDLSHWKGDPKDKEWQTYVAGLRRFVQKDASAALPISVSQTSTGHPKKYTPIAIAVAIAALAIAGVVLWAMNRTTGSGAKPAAAIAAATPAAKEEVTLAVLPFRDMSAGKDQEYFADGLSEEILNQVAQVEGLMVTARTSSFSFKGKDEDMRVIGEKLGVANLLEGSVRKDGNDLRITAQLIKSSTGGHLWSKTYDRELSKVFELQEEIARDVAQALSIKLDVGEMSRAKGGTTNLEAYDKWLRGNAFIRQLKWTEALPYYREATDLDPNYLLAWLNEFAAVVQAGLPPEKMFKEMTSIRDRIEAIAPGSWQALHLRAANGQFGQKWFDQQLAFEAALAAADKEESRTGRKVINIDYAHLHRKLGDMSGAQRLLEPWVKSDPSSILVSFWLHRHLFALGRIDEALSELDRAKTLAGYPGKTGSDFDRIDYEFLMTLRFRKNTDPVSIWTQYSTLVKTDPLLQSLFAKRNDPKAALEALNQAFVDAAGQPVGQQKVGSERIAFWADYFGGKDLALAAIRRGIVDEGYGFQRPYLWLPFVTNLRTDTRFKDIVRAAGFVEYWRRSGNWGDFCKPVGTDDFECH